MSGAGRSTAANVLEDSGWYVVDNLPPHLLVPLVELAGKGSRSSDLPRLAAVVDVRARGFFAHLQTALEELHQRGWHPSLVFLDASDEALVRRFESVRRPHPLQGEGRLLDGITRERALLADLRAQSDVVIDTSGLNVHQLAKKVHPVFATATGPKVRVAVMSFGFKYGLPWTRTSSSTCASCPTRSGSPSCGPSPGRTPPCPSSSCGRRARPSSSTGWSP
jgi:UPF0042 nucleotide-binding protein